MKKNLIIVGNTGEIGRCVERYYKNKKKYNIIGLNSSNCNLLNFEKCYYVLKKYTKNKSIIIFLSHLTRDNNNLTMFNKNIKMTVNLIRSISIENIEQLVFFSSVCVYGRPPIVKIITENTQCNPNEYYGLSKFVSEKLLENFLINKLTIFRIPGVYGNKFSKNIINKIISNSEEKKKIIIFNNGEDYRDFLYINDLIYFLNQTIKNKYFETFNIVSGKSTKIKNIASIIQKKFQNNLNIIYSNRKQQNFDLKFNNSKLNNITKKFKFSNLKNEIKNLI
tara:strand:- start:10265 stop:11101 length:837 start_codon:yes stop_codon:yes gene_type:complete